jgi:hypothetical protein
MIQTMGASASQVNNDEHPLMHPDIFVLIAQALSRCSLESVLAWCHACKRTRRLQQRIRAMIARMQVEAKGVHPVAVQYPNPAAYYASVDRYPHTPLVAYLTAREQGIKMNALELFAPCIRYNMANVTLAASLPREDSIAVAKYAVRFDCWALSYLMYNKHCREIWPELSQIAADNHSYGDILLTKTVPYGEEFRGMMICKQHRTPWPTIAFTCMTLELVTMTPSKQPIFNSGVVWTFMFAYMATKAVLGFMRPKIMPPLMGLDPV